jgi:hypothetical protein
VIGGNAMTVSTLTANIMTTSTLTTTGNVGINYNVDSPNYKLVIEQGLGNSSNGLFISNTNYGSMQGFGLSMVNNGSSNFFSYASIQGYTSGVAAVVPLCLQPTSGNVGIGTNGPSAPLHVYGAGTAASYSSYQFTIGSNTSPRNIIFGVNDTSGSIQSTVNLFNTPAAAWLTLNPLGGNVGIGTASPGYTLDIRGSLQLTGIGIVNQYSDNIFFNVTANDSTNGNGGTTVYSNSINLRAGDLTWTGNRVYGAQIYIGGGYSIQGANNPGALIFSTNNTARMTILGNGNVGIGTDSPTGTLQLTSTYPQTGIWPGPTLNFQFNTGAGGYWMAGAIVGYVAANAGGTGNYPGGLAFQTKNPDNVIGSAPTTKMVIDSNGNVGIGTNNPISPAKLYVYSTGSPTGWEGMAYFGNATAGFVCGSYSNGVLIGGHLAALNNWANITIGSPDTTTTIPGALSKGGGTFDIAHPLYSDHKKRLVHSFIEGPRCDLIYRGTKQLINGTITIDINKECTYNPNGAMDDGTFEALCANAECFLQNKSSFARVMGTISGCILTITCENASNDTIVWMVIAERKDSFIKKWNRTDDNGFLITQYTDENHLDM